MDKKQEICVAQIGAAHGVRGEVRVKAFTEIPEALEHYGPLHDTDGRKYRITAMRPAKSMLVVKFKGVNSRNDAELLNGTRLYVDRACLPGLEDEDEFYQTDLIGLKVETAVGDELGTVAAVQDFGAGDLLEIRPSAGPTLLVPFTREAVPIIDLDNGRVVIDFDEGEADTTEPGQTDS